MIKGVLIAIVFFLLGFSLQAVPLPAESRLAATDVAVESTQRIPFDAIKVYPDEVVIAYPGLRYAKVTSNSMAPIITDKSIVFEKAPDVIKEGDVISFYEPSEDTIILHAVVEVIQTAEGPLYRTKGLANSDADPWLVPHAKVKGVMVGTFR